MFGMTAVSLFGLDAHSKLQNCYIILILAVVQLTAVVGVCQPPPEGLWNMDVYLPPIQNFKKEGRACGELKRDPNLKEVYTGDFKGVSALLRSRTISRLFFVFDEGSCSLYGSNVIPVPGVHDTLLMSWDGKGRMAAIAGVLLQGHAIMPARALYIFDYLGPVNSTMTSL